MTRFTNTALTITALIAASATAAHASDTFQASFSYDKAAPVEVTLENFKKSASAVCKQQLTEAGFRKTEGTSFKQRKCERELVKNAVKGTNDRVLMSLYQSDKKGTKTVQMALNTK